MSSTRKKNIIWLMILSLSLAVSASAQQDSPAVDTTGGEEPVVATDSAAPAVADSIVAGGLDSLTALDSLDASPDSSSDGREEPEEDVQAAPRERTTAKAKPKGPPRKPASSSGAIPMKVIDWDWDDYAHVTAIGLRHLDTEREYELEHNDVYQKIWERQRDAELWVWGESKNLGDGFWAFVPEKFEPLLTMAAADSIAAADSTARVDSIAAAADSIAQADSLAVLAADSTARADSLAATADTTAAPAGGAAPAAAPANAPAGSGANAAPAAAEAVDTDKEKLPPDGGAQPAKAEGGESAPPAEPEPEAGSGGEAEP